MRNEFHVIQSNAGTDRVREQRLGDNPSGIAVLHVGLLVQAIHSLKYVNRGCNLRSPCYRAADLETFLQFAEAPPLLASLAVALIDDIVVIPPPKIVLNMQGVADVTR